MAETDADTQQQLNSLEEEEARIMSELRELDEKNRLEREAHAKRQSALLNDPEAALVTLLLECEKEVRDAKGFIAHTGPPLKISRVKHGNSAPKGATYLSRPKNTGVDFTVPLTTRDYTSVVKKPMFLNTIRDKIRARTYTSPHDYLDDMRLMARNTAQFNKRPDLEWVVQHANLLLEAAEDAVASRRAHFQQVEDAFRASPNHKPRAPPPTHPPHSTGKRKRSAAAAASVALDTNGDSSLPALGQAIDVYWQNYRRWFSATIVGKSGSSVHVVYEEDSTDQWIDLKSNVRWRVRNSRAAASSAKTKRGADAPSSKRRKGTAASVVVDTPGAPVHVPTGLSGEDLDALRDEFSNKADDIKRSVIDMLDRHLVKFDRTIARNDQLDRVLLAIQDSKSVVDDMVNRLFERQALIEKKLENVLAMSSKLTLDSGTKSQPANCETPKQVEQAVDATDEIQPVEKENNAIKPLSNNTKPVQVIDIDSSSDGGEVNSTKASMEVSPKAKKSTPAEEGEKPDNDVEMEDAHKKPVEDDNPSSNDVGIATLDKSVNERPGNIPAETKPGDEGYGGGNRAEKSTSKKANETNGKEAKKDILSREPPAVEGKDIPEKELSKQNAADVEVKKEDKEADSSDSSEESSDGSESDSDSDDDDDDDAEKREGKSGSVGGKSLAKANKDSQDRVSSKDAEEAMERENKSGEGKESGLEKSQGDNSRAEEDKAVEKKCATEKEDAGRDTKSPSKESESVKESTKNGQPYDQSDAAKKDDDNSTKVVADRKEVKEGDE